MLHLTAKNSPKGFSLVEIMVVVAIIGLLAALAVIAFRHHRVRAQAAALGSDMRVFRDALEQCVMDTGEYALGAPAGQVSATFDPYVRNGNFTAESPVGGSWIVESDVDGVKLLVSVINFTAGIEPIELVDRLFDDGNTSTGNMRLMTPSKYSCIVEE